LYRPQRYHNNTFKLQTKLVPKLTTTTHLSFKHNNKYLETIILQTKQLNTYNSLLTNHQFLLQPPNKYNKCPTRGMSYKHVQQNACQNKHPQQKACPTNMSNKKHVEQTCPPTITTQGNLIWPILLSSWFLVAYPKKKYCANKIHEHISIIW